MRVIMTAKNIVAELYTLFEPLLSRDCFGFKNGEDGRRRHTAYSRCYSHGSLNNYYPIFQKLSNELVSRWSAVPDGLIDVQDDIFSLAIKIISQASFGQWFNNEEEVMNFYHHHMLIWRELEVQLVEGPPEPGSDREKQFINSQEVHKETLRKAMRLRQQLGRDVTAEPLAIDVIMELGGTESEQLGDALDLFYSGFHTTGMTLTWCLFYLAKHPDIQQKLYQELCEVLGDGDVDNDNIGQLVYTSQVLDETLRCSALVTFAARYCDTDCILDGHVVPAKAPIFIPLGVVLEDPDLWPDPQRFDPDRFSPEQRKAISPYQFEPFGFAGKRKCPGYRFAAVESISVLSILIRRFKFHLAEGQSGQVTKSYSLVTTPKEKIILQVEKRT